jgi:hypothetical protein
MLFLVDFFGSQFLFQAGFASEVCSPAFLNDLIILNCFPLFLDFDLWFKLECIFNRFKFTGYYWYLIVSQVGQRIEIG